MRWKTLAVAVVCLGWMVLSAPVSARSAPVYFDWFEYVGHDKVFEEPAPPHSYRNPILAGFYPDPSVTRVNDRFYLVNSTFAYFPGIPVFESRDLVHWRPIGNVIDRPSQLSFDGLGISRGVFAPSISFHDGVFYVINTAVDSGGNFISIARDPAGPWSDPIWLSGLGGIDPSLFFDADGKVYVVNNDVPPGPPQYDGHRAIWIQELDLAARKLVGPRKVLVNGGVDITKKPVWIEGPHLYQHNGWYYLMCAEGGTGPQHSEVIFRARSPWGPFEPFAGNPILTQRDLPVDRANPITNAGHADLLEAPDGKWWAVFLASRPYEQVHYNTGRETFLLPVQWHEGWPIILPHGTAIPYIAPAPASVAADPLATPTSGNFLWRDDFDARTLAPQWLQIRVPKERWYDLSGRPGWLTIDPLPVPLNALTNPSYLGHRQQHTSFDASTELELPPPGVSAGLAAFQSENAWYFLGIRRRDATSEAFELFVECYTRTEHGVTSKVVWPYGGRVKLRISGNARTYTFYADTTGSGRWKPLPFNGDSSMLSTDVAGGFVGSTVGPYARADERPQ